MPQREQNSYNHLVLKKCVSAAEISFPVSSSVQKANIDRFCSLKGVQYGVQYSDAKTFKLTVFKGALLKISIALHYIK